MRFVNTNRKLRNLRAKLAPLTWHTEHEYFKEYAFKAHQEKPNIIIGHWAEDGAPYEITCPEQIRDILIIGLNLLNKIIIR